LEFDYFLDQGQATDLSVVLQHLPAHDRSAWHVRALQPGAWHHAEIDLLAPDEILGGADSRTRLEFAVSATGDPEDSFFVYIDDVRVRSDSAPEAPLAIGLTATVLSSPPASHLLADGPGLRPGDRHPVLLSRVQGADATFLTLLETYVHQPRWGLAASPDGTFWVGSNDVTDVVSIDPTRRAYSLARTRRDGTPELLALFNRISGGAGSWEIQSLDPIDLEIRISAAGRDAAEYSYQTGSDDDWFTLRVMPSDRYSGMLIDGTRWDWPPSHTKQSVELGPLPGGNHRIQFELAGATTTVEEWNRY
jgi:hypothetical protein